jgi:hypothetical protein
MIKNFLSKYTTTTHSIATAVAFLFAAYYAVPAFHDAVWLTYDHIPNWGKTIVTVGLALYSFYRNGEKQQSSQDGKP